MWIPDERVGPLVTGETVCVGRDQLVGIAVSPIDVEPGTGFGTNIGQQIQWIYRSGRGSACGGHQGDDVPTAVAEKVHTIGSTQDSWDELDNNTRKRKISRVKTHLNNVAASLMTKARLDQVDPGGDIINWFAQMKQLTNV